METKNQNTSVANLQNNQVEEISLIGLEQLITEKVGIPIKFNKEIRFRRDNDTPYLEVESQELRMFSGILSNQYESLKICNFGGGLHSDGLGYYWLPLHFAFSYVNGGSNGNKICDFWYEFETKTWKIMR